MRSRLLCAAALLALLATGCASVAGVGGASSVAGSAREEQVAIPRFTDVYGVAVSQRSVFLLTNGALGIYDRIFHRWALPVTLEEGASRGLAVIAADPASDAVWIGGTGLIARYEPALELWTRSVVPGRVEEIVFDRRDPASGALIHSAGSWSRVSPAGAVTPLFGSQLPSSQDVIAPITIDDLRRDFPALRTTEPLLTRDASMRSWPVISGSRAVDRMSEVWLGTFGGGVYEADPTFNRSQHHAFGLADNGAGALARAADGIWIAPRGSVAPPLGASRASPSRGSMTFASEDLQRWRWLDPDPASGLGGGRLSELNVYDLIVAGETMWVASDRGLLRLSTQPRGDSRAVNASAALAGERVNALVFWRGDLAAASARGVAMVDTARLTSTPLMNASVHALAAMGDTLWIGTELGLYSARGAGEPSVQQVGARAIRALAHSDTLLIAASERELFRVAGTSVTPLFPALDLAVVGGIESVDVDARSVVAVGSMGAAVIARSTGALRIVRTAGAAYDVLLTSTYLWIATDAGLLRVQRVGESIP